jgi:hypothetical protein
VGLSRTHARTHMVYILTHSLTHFLSRQVKVALSRAVILKLSLSNPLRNPPPMASLACSDRRKMFAKQLPLAQIFGAILTK